MQLTQYSKEPFHEYWERFKILFVQCPHHGFKNWQKVQFFYEGLIPESRHTRDSMDRGSLVMNTPEEAIEAYKTICENSQRWDFFMSYELQ